jgi:prefoldin alpha subunit
MLEAELLANTLEQLEQRLEMLDRNIHEALALTEHVKAAKELKEGDELHVPLASGIFVPATARGEDRFLVNIGSNVIVPKNAAQVEVMVHGHVAELQSLQERFRAEFEATLQKLQALEQHAE